MKKNEQEQYLKDLTWLFDNNPCLSNLMANYVLTVYGNNAVLTPESYSHEFQYLKETGNLHVVFDLALHGYGQRIQN